MKISEMSVQLLDSMGTDLSVVNAARVSFHKESNWEMQPAYVGSGGKYLLNSKDEKLIKYLAKHNHWSPFAHTSIQLRVKVPIFIARQLQKHQVGFSWNEVSRRYVDEEPEFYFPKYCRKKAENVKQGSSDEPAWDHSDYWAQTYIDELDSSLDVKDICSYSLKLYAFYLKAGVCPEQARMFLPQNMMTEFIWTGSLYGFARVCNQRLDPHAQKEVQEVAALIKDICFKLFPVSSKYLIGER